MWILQHEFNNHPYISRYGTCRYLSVINGVATDNWIAVKFMLKCPYSPHFVYYSLFTTVSILILCFFHHPYIQLVSVLCMPLSSISTLPSF